MNVWTALLDVLILLFFATVLGGLFERFRQNAIMGYLLAGVLVGPHAFALMPDREAIATIAELGVALLLFMIGLEFSWRRLKNLGIIAFGGGAAQVVVTVAVTMLFCRTLGLELRESFIIGAMVALSSTAIVMRLLADRAEVDSLHGRSVLGILLLQDIAVVPLILMVTLLAEEGTSLQLAWAMARALGVAFLMGLALYLILGHAIPWLLGRKEAIKNRDLPVLVAMIVAVGCAWGSHAVGLSPVLGSFVGGVILAESPFAIQVRSDVAALKTLFVTLFFASIGMLTNPEFALDNSLLIGALVMVAIAGKLLVTAGVMRLFKAPRQQSAATALCLAQIGEFSFVIAEVARSGSVISAEYFEIIITVIVGTLFLTPYMVAWAPRFGLFVAGGAARDAEPFPEGDDHSPHVVIIGFGPAGQAVAEELLKDAIPAVVIELNAQLSAQAESRGVTAVVGDAIQTEVLRHAGVESACLVAITVPDPVMVTQTVAQIRQIAPATHIIARARYSRFHAEIAETGADIVVDEELEVGLRVASELRRMIRTFPVE